MDLRKAEWQSKHSDADIHKGIVEGVGGTKMRSFKDKFSDKQLDGLVALIRSFKKADAAAPAPAKQTLSYFGPTFTAFARHSGGTDVE